MRRGRFVLLALLILAIASLWRTFALEREKRHLTAAYQHAQQALTQLEAERTQLNQELTGAHQTIEQQGGEMTTLQDSLKELGARLAQTTTELTSLQHDYQQLRTSHETLMTEKQRLEAKLSSIKELKLAILDVKRQMWNRRLAAWRAHIQVMKEADRERLASGNRGYLVREGVPTFGPRTKLQVRVLEPQSQ